jgi:hypoxanthine phosphoribosyltransferase
MADLLRAISVPCEIDFMSVSSYGSGTKTSGVVKIVKDLDINLEGKDILIVEDILDSGKTLYHLRELLSSRNPNSFKICTLLDKPERREVPIEPEYTCFVIEDEFVIGYGLDYAEKYRNLPYVAVLKRSVYEN